MGRRSTRWSWVLLPEDEAVERWRWEQRAGRVVAGIALGLAIVAVVVAVVNLRSEGSLVHAEAVAIAERDDSRTLVEWQDEGGVQRAVYEEREQGLAVGDTIDVVYPAGHPEEVRAADGPEILIGMLAMFVVVVGGVAVGYVVRYRPRARQLDLVAAAAPGAPRTVEIVEGNGRSVVLERDLERDVVLAAGIGGASTLDLPLPPSPQDAVVVGDVAKGSVVVVRLGDSLLNTDGRVRAMPSSGLVPPPD